MRTRRDLQKGGYTFLETMVALLLLSVVLIAVYGVILTGNSLFNRHMALLDVEQQTRNAVDRIVREVRQASSQIITTNYMGTTNDKILFTMPTAAGVQYYLNGTNLVREYPSGEPKNVASNISLLKFQITGALLKVEVRAEKQIQGGTTISFPLIEKVRLRNE